MREADPERHRSRGDGQPDEHLGRASPEQRTSSDAGTPFKDIAERSEGFCKSAAWWLDWYFNLFGASYVLTSLVLGVGTYVLGLAIAWAVDFAPDYLGTTPLYVGLIGIMWTGTYVGWGRKRTCELLEEIETAFQPSAQQYSDTASRWLRRLLDWRPQVALSLIAILASFAYVWYATGIGEFPWFPRSWSTAGPDLWATNVILLVYAIPVLVLSTSALTFIVVFTLFVFHLRKLHVMPIPPAALALLRPIADFGFMLCLGWSAGVSLFIWFFRPSVTPGSVLLVIALSVIAFTILFAPQYAIHSTLLKAKRIVLEAAGHELARDVRMDDVGLAKFIAGLSSTQSQELGKVVESISSSRTWVYNYGSLLPLVTPVGLPAAAFVLGQVLGD